MPLGNPYSMHTSGSAYSAPGQPSYYPQQTHFLAQPAAQPFVPGQTILMVPGQQDSGRGLGSMIKEALVFSTINAGVNRIINPHTHHYVESKPDSTSNPAPTTHITYNNQYFNTPPGVDMNSTNPSQGIGSTINNYSSGNNSPYVPNTPTSAPSSISVENRIGTSTGSNTNENKITPTTGFNAANNQKNLVNNSANIDNTFSYKISDDELFRISEELFMKNSRNISQYIKLNLQTRVTSPNVTDEAREPYV